MFVIAGATGHVGSRVASELLAKKKKVRVVVREAAKGAPWKEQGAEVAVASLEDRAALTEALRGASGFFTLLPPNFAATDVLAWQKQTGESIAAAVKASGVAHVVLLSSVGADLPAGTGPIQGLHHLENALRDSGAKLTAIRAGYFQENVANAVQAVRDAGIFPVFAPSADYPFPMIATKDIAALAAKSLLDGASAHENVDLRGPAYTMRAVAEKLGAALKKPVEVVLIPEANWSATLVGAGVPKPMADAYAEMYGAFAAGKIAPRGDRLVQGTSEIDEVIASLV